MNIQLSFLQIYELSISMVTALLGIAYPLFIDKIYGISERYKSRRLSERFQHEFSYQIFNRLLIACIIEMFIIPYIVLSIQNPIVEMWLITIHTISVFILAMCMIVLYDVIMIYNNPIRLFNYIRIAVNPRNRFLDIIDLALYAATDEEQIRLFEMCLNAISQHIIEFQQQEIDYND